MGAAEMRAELLSLLAEVEDVTVALGLTALAHGAGLTEGQLAEALAGASAALDRLCSLQDLLPAEGSPDLCPPEADAP
jgi:hypothetical protein